MLTAVSAVALTATVLTSGSAAATTPVDSYLNWTIVFPIVGRIGPVTTEVETTLPGSVPEGVPSSSAMTINTTLPAPCSGVIWQTIPDPASYGNEADISGSEQVTLTATDSAGEQYTENLVLAIPPTEVLLVDGNGWVPITFPAAGSVSLPAMAHPGPATVRISAMALTLDARTLDGKDGVLGTRTYPLTLSSTGPTQNPANSTTLGTVEVGS